MSIDEEPCTLKHRDPFPPECPVSGGNCRFVKKSIQMTSIHSPIVYDRNGQVVGGGLNSITEVVACLECGGQWEYKQTELQRLKGEPPTVTRLANNPFAVISDRMQRLNGNY